MFVDIGGWGKGDKTPKYIIILGSVDFSPESAKYGLKPCETQVSYETFVLSDSIQVENEQALSQQCMASAQGKSWPSGGGGL